MPRESGSAYLLSLLVLVMLSFIGAMVVSITQTEVQIGSNDRSVNRVFYAANSSTSLSVARAMVNADYDSKQYEISDPDGAALNIRHQIDDSPFLPILDAPCNLCQINDAGNYAEDAYRKINYAVTTVATRIGGPQEVVLARNSQATMVEVQPWKSSVEALVIIDQPDELKKVKF